MTTDTMEPGSKLKNGATVLDVGGYRPAGQGLVASVIVLAESANDFVTWEVGVVDGDAFWGHYFPKHTDPERSEADAVADFVKRISR